MTSQDAPPIRSAEVPASRDDTPQETVVEHFVARSVPVLFVSSSGLQMRKFHSLLPSGSATYATLFCDLERWSSHLKLASVGLTSDYCSSTDTSGSNGSAIRSGNHNLVRFVEASRPSAIDNSHAAEGTG